jgi:prepilin-type N-terminal cleavage/methylation domain-containing protein
MNKSFTLIEILVVIVVIGVLSAFILVGMSSITNSANIAKGQAFSNSLRNSLLINLVSGWKLDGGTVGQTVLVGDILDSWGTNNASSVTSDPVVRGFQNCVSNNCLDFDGDDWVSFGNKSNLHFASNFTIEAWVNISSVPTSAQDCMILGDYNGVYKGYKFSINNDRKVYMEVGRQSDTTTTSLTSIQQLDLNRWHHVVASYDGRTNVFLNGIRTRGGADYSPIEAEVANIIMGKAQWYAQYFVGLIDDVRVYNKEVSLATVNNNYYSGLNKLIVNNVINGIEYMDRLSELENNSAKQ